MELDPNFCLSNPMAILKSEHIHLISSPLNLKNRILLSIAREILILILLVMCISKRRKPNLNEWELFDYQIFSQIIGKFCSFSAARRFSQQIFSYSILRYILIMSSQMRIYFQIGPFLSILRIEIVYAFLTYSALATLPTCVIPFHLTTPITDKK